MVGRRARGGARLRRLRRFRLLGRLCLAGFLCVVGIGPAGASGPIRALPQELIDWPRGPVIWLLQPSEYRAYHQQATREDALSFIRSFWRRRDPTPEDEANPFADTFSERVAIADQLFTEEAVRGALTDRGGALIVLGSPHSVKLLRRRAPALKPGRPPRAGDGALRAEDVEVERWRYTRAAVAPHLPGIELPEEIELEFVRRPNRVSWVSGRSWIERAARSAVRNALP